MNEDPEGQLAENLAESSNVSIIEVETEVDDAGSNVEFIELEDGEVLEYKGGLVALTDGSRWIPVAEVKISDGTADEDQTIIKVTENEVDESIEISTNEECSESKEDSPQVLILEDGSIAYLQSSKSKAEFEDVIISSPQNAQNSENKAEKKKGKKVYACWIPGCGRSYSTLHHLKVHNRNHTGDRPYKCTAEGCDKAFSTDYSRKAHLRTHTGEKPYSCPSPACGKQFKTSGDLQKHIRIHTGERPFTCPVKGCNRSFTTSNIRKVHIRTHTGEKPYTCTHEGCKKSFASSTNFKNHMRIHSGIKPYCCKVPNCSKRFTEYSSLYKHQLVHSQQKKHQCNLCQKSYQQPSTLTTHKRTTHGVISADDGTEVVIKNLVGIRDNRHKKFKDITSKLLKLKRNCSTIITIEEEGTPLYLVSTDIENVSGLEELTEEIFI